MDFRNLWALSRFKTKMGQTELNAECFLCSLIYFALRLAPDVGFPESVLKIRYKAINCVRSIQKG